MNATPQPPPAREIRKQVLIFAIAYHPFVGGAEIAVKEITDRIPDIEFHMATLNVDGRQPSEEQIGNVHVHRIGRGTLGKFLFPIRGFLLAHKLHKRLGFAAFWSIMANQSSVAAAFVKKSSPNVPLILTVQEGDDESHLKRYVFGIEFLYKLFIRPWHTLVFKRANLVTAISTHLAERARKINANVPIEVVPNGVDVSAFTREFSESELKVAREEIGKTPDTRIIITTSRLAKKNAGDDVIKALQFLPESTRFAIIGSGELEVNLRELANQLRVSHRVIFLGHKPHEEIPRYLAASDIFARPSISEGMGNSLIEAMAAGIPVVATAVGGIPDFLRDNETGIFCKVRNPKSLADKITLVLEDENLRTRIIANARAMVCERYDWNRIAAEFNECVFARLGVK